MIPLLSSSLQEVSKVIGTLKSNAKKVSSKWVFLCCVFIVKRGLNDVAKIYIYHLPPVYTIINMKSSFIIAYEDFLYSFVRSCYRRV